MKNTKFAIIFAALICRGFLSLLTAGQGFAAEPTLIQAGYGGIAGYQLPLWVNKEASISRKYGIELQPLLISGGSLNMQALLADDMESIEATYEFFSRRTEAVPRPSLEGLKNILREMDASQRNPGDFVDMSLLDEIEKEGFIQKLR